jgi:hypothetical protein
MSGRIEPEFKGIRGIERTTPEFRAKLTEVAEHVGASPRDLACVISFETGHSFSPSQRNAAGSTGVGLIQFMAGTCRELGITRKEMASLSAIDQLDYVERFLKMKAQERPLDTARDLYMAVIWPEAIGRGENFRILYQSSEQYRMNKGTDLNHDGRITAGEAARKMLDAALDPRHRDRAQDTSPEPAPPEPRSNWKAELASIGIRFMLEYIRNTRETHDPDMTLSAEQTWRLFSDLASITPVREKLHTLTTLDGPDLVHAVKGIVEAYRGVDRGASDVTDSPAKREVREPALAP